MRLAQSFKPCVFPDIFKYLGWKHLAFLPKHTSKDDFCWIREMQPTPQSLPPPVLMHVLCSPHPAPADWEHRTKTRQGRPTSGSSCRPIDENKVSFPFWNLAGWPRKNKGFKLNCRGGVFLKGWGYARSWMSSPCVTKNPMSNNKQTHCMNSHLESSSECFWGSEIHFSCSRQGRWETARHRLQGTTAPKPLLLWRQHHPRPPVLPSDLTFQALKNTNISAGTVHSPLPADPHQLILTRLCSQQL